MMRLEVDGLTFTFSAGWSADKYDDWSFYRNQFGKMRDGIKAIDLLVLDPDNTAWFVEVRDYRRHPHTKPSELGDELSRKVFDTLAALLPAQVSANEEPERQMASAILRASRLRVVLHLEQPAKHSRLRPRAINPADVAQKLRRLLKPIDAHPVVAETDHMRGLGWRVA